MHTQKKHRKSKLEAHKDCGDMLRTNTKEIRQMSPRDRGDSRRKNVSQQGSPKTNKSKSVKTDLVSRSTNTVAESMPVSFENHAMNEDTGLDKCLDFRQRVKDKYTFKRYLKKNDDASEFRCNVENERPKYSNIESAKPKSNDSRETKKSDRTSVHRAVSAMKIKRTTADSAERKTLTKEINSKNKKTVITTIQSTDTRVYKDVTFVDNTPKKTLHIKIPNKEKPKPKIPLTVPVASMVQKTRVLRKILPPQPSPTLKSADSLPTEIAKWVPESINQLTMPYYEAWVSKTATASTKLLEEAEKSEVLRELESKKSPELLYKRYQEEEYKGRIRVRQREK